MRQNFLNKQLVAWSDKSCAIIGIPNNIKLALSNTQLMDGYLEDSKTEQIIADMKAYFNEKPQPIFTENRRQEIALDILKVLLRISRTGMDIFNVPNVTDLALSYADAILAIQPEKY